MVLLVRSSDPAAEATAANERWFGEATVDEQEGMRQCLHEGLGLGPGSVSYTHLDVYKRQGRGSRGPITEAIQSLSLIHI